MVEAAGKQQRPISGIHGSSLAHMKRQGAPHRAQIISSLDGQDENINRANKAQELAGDLYNHGQAQAAVPTGAASLTQK